MGIRPAVDAGSTTRGALPAWQRRFSVYWRLARLDRPVGTLLLLWPTLAALWIAAEGVPPLGVVAAFVAGTFLARSAGCVINDIADRRVDGGVRRTRNRPLATGEASVREALWLAGAFALAAALVLLTLHPLTWLLAAAGAAITVLYPFLKRWTHFPQAALGLAFSWGIPMAFAAVTGDVPAVAWLMVAASAVWIVGYDTLYAMTDRDDDVRVGIKSTAIAFGRWDRAAVGALQLATLGLLAILGAALGLRDAYYLGLAAIGGLFAYQQWLVRRRQPAACLRAFGNNVWVGFVLFAATAAHYALA